MADETAELIKQIVQAKELDTLPAERIWKEFERALGEPSPECFFSLLDQVGATKILFPHFTSLEKTTIDVLKKAAKKRLKNTIRFAILFVHSNPEDVEACCNTIKAPNVFRELANLICLYSKSYQDIDFTAEKALKLLTETDAFRRPERFSDFLNACELLYGYKQLNQDLNKALSIATSVKAETFVKQGLKGKAIAAALEQKRLEEIQQQLNIN